MVAGIAIRLRSMVWLFVYHHSARLNPSTLFRSRETLAAAGKTFIFVAAGGFLWTFSYCTDRAEDAPALVEKILWWIWPGACIAALVSACLFMAVKWLRNALNDYKRLRPSKDVLEIVKRSWISEVWRNLELAQSRRLFVERLVSVRKVEWEWPGAPPYTGNDWASAELARLDERWRGLER
jgi:hypothetical protein